MDTFLIVILSIYPLTIQSYEMYFCGSKSDGNYPDPESCYNYYQCSSTVTYHHPCVSGLVWRQDLDRCDYGVCSIPTTTTTTTTTTAATTTTTTTAATTTTIPTVPVPSMEYVSYDLEKNRYINGFVLNREKSRSVIDCGRKCLQLENNNCKGYNYYKSNSICELLSDVMSASLALPNVILAKRVAKPP